MEQLSINFQRHFHEIIVNPMCIIALTILGVIIAIQARTFFYNVGKKNFFADIFGSVKIWVGFIQFLSGLPTTMMAISFVVSIPP